MLRWHVAIVWPGLYVLSLTMRKDVLYESVKRLVKTRKEDLNAFFTTFEISCCVFPYLVKLNDNGSYHGLREPIRKLENHYPELKIY